MYAVRVRILLCLTVLAVAATVRAQEAPPQQQEAASPENAEAAAQARQHFTEGMAHFEGRRFREAIHAFQLAASIVPSADLWFNIARSYEELNDEPSLRQAIEYYQRYLRDRVDPPDRAQVEAKIQLLQERAEAARQARLSRPTTGTLRISSTVEGADVRVDEEGIGTAPVAAPVTLSEGTHRVDVEREGYIPFRSQVQIAPGVAAAAYADLEPATQYRAVRGKRIFTWIVGGLAVAGVATSIGLGARARSMTRGDDVTDEDFADARDLSAISDYVLGASLALAVGAIVLYFVEGRAIGTERVTVEEASVARPTAF